MKGKHCEIFEHLNHQQDSEISFPFALALVCAKLLLATIQRILNESDFFRSIIPHSTR